MALKTGTKQKDPKCIQTTCEDGEQNEDEDEDKPLFRRIRQTAHLLNQERLTPRISAISNR